MIRESLSKAIENALCRHLFLDRSDFILRKYENSDGESCLNVGYRHNRIYSFVFEMKKREESSKHLIFAVTMNPGHDVSQETTTADGEFALLRELKQWQQRLHEDAGAFPISRQLQHHLAGIDRMRERLALMPDDLPAQLERRSDILDELNRWQSRLDRFVSSLQEMRQRVVISMAKSRFKAIDALRTRLRWIPEDFSVDLGQIAGEIRLLIGRAMADRESMAQGTLCLLADAEFLPAIDQVETHSKRIEALRKHVTSLPDDAFTEQIRRIDLIENFDSCLVTLSRGVDSIKSYRQDDIPKQLKRHLIEIHQMRERFERIMDDPLSREEIARFYAILDPIKSEVTKLFAAAEAEKQELGRTVSAGLQTRWADERNRRQTTIAFLEEKVRIMESIVRRFLDNMVDPSYALDKATAWQEGAVLRLTEEKRTLCAAMEFLKKDVESEEKLRQILRKPPP